MDDKIAKGRQAKGEMFNCKLTSAIVLEILARRDEPQAEIAKSVGVHQSHISRILSRQSWKHLSPL
jgi:hypothetical protein